MHRAPGLDRISDEKIALPNPWRRLNEVSVTVTHLEVQPGNYVWLTVGDPGHAGGADVLGRIFLAFFTTKRAETGTSPSPAIFFGRS